MALSGPTRWKRKAGVRHFQRVQARARRTVAVARRISPGLKAGGRPVEELLEDARGLTTSEDARLKAEIELRAARQKAQKTFAQVRAITLGVAAIIQAQTRGGKARVDLRPVFRIVPRTWKRAGKRGRTLLPRWRAANRWLAGQTPPVPPITLAGIDADALALALPRLPREWQDLATAETAFQMSCGVLRSATRALDRWNKRFYKKLYAETWDDPKRKLVQGIARAARRKKGTRLAATS